VAPILAVIVLFPTPPLPPPTEITTGSFISGKPRNCNTQGYLELRVLNSIIICKVTFKIDKIDPSTTKGILNDFFFWKKHRFGQVKYIFFNTSFQWRFHISLCRGYNRTSTMIILMCFNFVWVSPPHMAIAFTSSIGS
jgi:hypothetical protein